MMIIIIKIIIIIIIIIITNDNVYGTVYLSPTHRDSVTARVHQMSPFIQEEWQSTLS